MNTEQNDFEKRVAGIGAQTLVGAVTARMLGASLALSMGLAAVAGCGLDEPGGGKTSGQATSALLPGDPNWAAGIAKDAILAGVDTDGETLYACRGVVGNTITPGKIRPTWTACDVSNAGQEIWVSDYQTLVPAWVNTSGGAIPTNAFPVGYESSQAPLFACRANFGSGLHLGKVRPGLAGCNIPYGGKEVILGSYQVLTNTNNFAVSRQSLSVGQALPANAIHGGTDDDGSTLYPCLVAYSGGIQAGKTRSGWGTCDISFGGAEIFVSSAYQVLVPRFNAPVPGVTTRAFVAGTDGSAASLGICQADYLGSVQVGKYRPEGTCLFPFGGQEITASTGFRVFSYLIDSNPINWSVPVISFSDPIPVGGRAFLTVKSDGSYLFQGNFHDSGFPSYNDKFTLGVPTANGAVLTFSHSGHVTGTDGIFGSGSRDDAWTVAGTNATITSEWSDLKVANQLGILPIPQASVSFDFGDLLSFIVTAYGYVSKVVTIVAAIV